MRLQFVVENLESITFWCSAFSAFLGGIFLLVVIFCWNRVKLQYREFGAKLALSLFRALTAGSAIASRAIPVQKDQPLLSQPWVSTTAISIVGYLLWELAGLIGDHRNKLAKEESRAHLLQEVQDANQDRDYAQSKALELSWVLTHLRELVREKLKRVRSVVRERSDARASLQQARDGLDPEEQVNIILEWLASVFHLEAIHYDKDYSQNFRVGLFVERADRLEPKCGFELSSRSHDPFSSYANFASRYSLNNSLNPSHAVRCVREGRTIIVADCRHDPDFEFFHENQRNYLRSMIAYPLADFCADGINPTRAALLIDTDRPEFFREENREWLESLLKEFATRIDLEYAIKGLTERSQKSGEMSDERNPHQEG